MNAENRDKEQAVRRLKEGFAGVPASRALSQELIAERREEARRENHEDGADDELGKHREETGTGSQEVSGGRSP